ncbi:U3 snoRNP protein [Xylographa opegraphella]|nr:U3 snoRNP protein [Xylographa opegraphella]
MSGASDKARFYLEQSIPELQEFERKKIFSKDEVASIAKRRSDFEHKLNGRGSAPADYARYAEYEMNLETLRRKRTKRMGQKYTGHTGQKRISFILDRATRKFHGDIGLWMQYLDYSIKQKAYKKVAQILTNLLRLHPTKPELWIYAAKYVMEDQGDMTSARSYMQRGLRFCKQSKELWLEYARLELIYIAKIAGRREILGLESHLFEKASQPALDDHEADHIALPVITAEDINPGLSTDDSLDQDVLRNLSKTPVLTGAIPIAIFNAAMENFKDVAFGERFYNMVIEFNSISCIGQISKHIVNSLMSLDSTSPASTNCFIRQPLAGVQTSSPEFPAILSVVLKQLSIKIEMHPSLDFLDRSMDWLLSYISIGDIDPDIRTVIIATLSRIMSRYRTVIETNNGGLSDRIVDLLRGFQSNGLEKLFLSTLAWSSEIWPLHPGLFALKDSMVNKGDECQ